MPPPPRSSTQLGRVCARVERQDKIRVEVPGAIQDRLRELATATSDSAAGASAHSSKPRSSIPWLERFSNRQKVIRAASVQVVSRMEQSDGVWRLDLEPGTVITNG